MTFYPMQRVRIIAPQSLYFNYEGTVTSQELYGSFLYFDEIVTAPHYRVSVDGIGPKSKGNPDLWIVYKPEHLVPLLPPDVTQLEWYKNAQLPANPLNIELVMQDMDRLLKQKD